MEGRTKAMRDEVTKIMFYEQKAYDEGGTDAVEQLRKDRPELYKKFDMKWYNSNESR